VHGISYESLDVHDGGEGTRRWEQAGRPVLPSLVVGDVTTPILHVSQLAAALGLPVPQTQEPTRLAWETLPVLRSWLDHVRVLDWDVMLRPTQSRGRSVRNLTVNVFHPFELLPGAWREGSFPWEPERDGERDGLLESATELVAYAGRIFADWTDFVLESAEALGRRNPTVVSQRGEVRFSALLESQLEHARFHHEQLVAFLST
jgi:hypothetical protein